MIVTDGLRRVKTVEVEELTTTRRVHEIRAMTFLHIEDELEPVHEDMLFQSGEHIARHDGRGFVAGGGAGFEWFRFGDDGHSSNFNPAK
ncbi:MAG: hypothetical protein QM813_11555 [Verrucomicrobiota bacterium]